MEAVDKSVPQPVRELDKPFLMPIEDIFRFRGGARWLRAGLSAGR